MMDKRQRMKGRKNSGSFALVPHAVLEHSNYASLSNRARSLLFDLFVQYRGSNNGDLAIAWRIMKKKGWRSKSTLYSAVHELEGKGFVLKTRQGGRHRCNLYAVTWLAIDDCGGKIDRPSTRAPLGYWKIGCNPELDSVPPSRTTLVQNVGQSLSKLANMSTDSVPVSLI